MNVLLGFNSTLAVVLLLIVILLWQVCHWLLCCYGFSLWFI